MVKKELAQEGQVLEIGSSADEDLFEGGSGAAGVQDAVVVFSPPAKKRRLEDGQGVCLVAFSPIDKVEDSGRKKTDAPGQFLRQFPFSAR